jgi:hypothetical protein
MDIRNVIRVLLLLIVELINVDASVLKILVELRLLRQRS